MKIKVLAIEDEQRWLDNYKAWLSFKVDLDCADKTYEAENLLREKRYHIVILDLAMSHHDQSERQNIDVQRYLATYPEGTKCIVVSAVAGRSDTRDSLVKYKADSVIFKPEIDPSLLLDRIIETYEDVAKSDQGLKAHSYNLLYGDIRGMDVRVFESKIIATLNPKGGASGLNQILSILLEQVYPIVLHEESSRRGLTVNANGVVCGLFWSRQLGHPISIVFFKKELSEEIVTASLDEWLGWNHGSEVIYKKEISNVFVQCFKEELSPEHFALPKIS